MESLSNLNRSPQKESFETMRTVFVLFILIGAFLVDYVGASEVSSQSSNHGCNGKTTLIASEYSDFDDSSRSFCMHVFNIPRTYTQYKKMVMRPCYDPDSPMKKREWLVDSDRYLRLASNLNTCVKYIPSAERGIGLSICNPNIASSMKNAVQVTYDQSSMRLWGTLVWVKFGPIICDQCFVWFWKPRTLCTLYIHTGQLYVT